MLDTCRHLKILHDADFYHCDIKLENVIIDKNHKTTKKAGVLIDMDFVTSVFSDRLKRGTARYLAPEYVKAVRGHAEIAPLSRTGKEFDVWAIGAMLWCICFGKKSDILFTNYTGDELKESVISNKHLGCLMNESAWKKFQHERIDKNSLKHANISTNVEARIKGFLKKLTHWDPTNRPSIDNCCEELVELLECVT